LAGPAVAQTEGVGISATADRTRATLGDTVVVTVKARFPAEAQATAEVKLQQSPDFELVSKAVSQQVSREQKQAYRTRMYTLVLQPRRAGSLTFNAAEFTYAGKRYATKPVLFEVVPVDPKDSPDAGAGKAEVSTPPAARPSRP
jgi:hypothetical protein